MVDVIVKLDACEADVAAEHTESLSYASTNSLPAVRNCRNCRNCRTTVGPLSDHCRTTVGPLSELTVGLTVGHCLTLSDYRTWHHHPALSDTVGHCRTTVGHCRTTVGRLSDGRWRPSDDSKCWNESLCLLQGLVVLHYRKGGTSLCLGAI